MTHRLLTLIAVCGLVLGSTALAQECPGSACAEGAKVAKSDAKECGGKSCSDCSDCTDCTDCGDASACSGKRKATLSAKVAKLEASAAKGCKTSETKLVAIRTAMGADKDAQLADLVAAYEKAGEAGCATSCDTLKQIQTILAPAPEKDALSVRVAALVKSANGGCEKSQAKLAAFGKTCGTDCMNTVVAKIDEIEGSAAEGCKKSAYKLALLEARFEGRPDPKAPLSLRVAMMEEHCEKGCETSGKRLVTLRETMGAKEGENLVLAIEKLEGSAAKGCETSAKMISTLEAKLPAMKTAKKESCGSASDCGKKCDGDCGSECKPEGCDKPDCCKKRKKSTTQ